MSASNSTLVQIARPYAAALFDLAGDAKQLPEVESGLDEVASLIGKSEDFERFLRSPVISAAEKTAAIDALIKDGLASGQVANFLRLVARNRRLFALSAMISEFKALAAKDPSLKERRPFKAALEGDAAYFHEAGAKAVLELLVATEAGMSQERFAAEVIPRVRD